MTAALSEPLEPQTKCQEPDCLPNGLLDSLSFIAVSARQGWTPSAPPLSFRPLGVPVPVP